MRYVYYRYIYDTFSAFDSIVEAVVFGIDLYSLHPFILFTMKEEYNSSLTFLDVLVELKGGSFITSVYSKHIFTGL